MRFWRILQYAISLMWNLLLLIRCSARETEPGAVAASSKERISSPDVARGDLRELADGCNAFAFALYEILSNGEDNLLYSPYSLSVALAMAYAGAQGQTAQQMADTLHFTLPQERLHPAFNALDLELASRSHASFQDASGDEVEEVAFQLNVANGLWGQKGYPFLPEYLDVLALNYDGGIRLADFKGNPAAAVNAINRWVSESTEGRIQDMVDALDEDTRLVLANAIYFNAKWDLPFEEERTRDESFHLLDGGGEKVPMMHQTNHFRYTEGDGYQAIQLPYLNRDVAMVIVLPREGRFREIEERLTGEWVRYVVNEFREHEVILTMPKFSFETPKIRLANTLSVMGMPDAFCRVADFSGMDGTRELFIDEVLHRAFIDVDEQRTEAAAVSVVVALGIGIEPEEPTQPAPIIMKIDRPFIFLIRDIETDAILFVGRVMNPAGE